MKTFIVDIELDTIEFHVTAKNKTEAKKKALLKLAKKNPKSLIKKRYPSNTKAIWVDEL